MVSFTTVFEYFYYLRELSISFQSLGNQSLFYLAAAVSDFYIEPSDMVSDIFQYHVYSQLHTVCIHNIMYK